MNMVKVGILSILDISLVINSSIAYGMKVEHDLGHTPAVAIPPGMHWQPVYTYNNSKHMTSHHDTMACITKAQLLPLYI